MNMHLEVSHAIRATLLIFSNLSIYLKAIFKYYFLFTVSHHLPIRFLL